MSFVSARGPDEPYIGIEAPGEVVPSFGEGKQGRRKRRERGILSIKAPPTGYADREIPPSSEIRPPVPRPKQKRRKPGAVVLEKLGDTCYFCGVKLTGATATRDHLTPTSRGGTNARDNLAPCCSFCNGRKGDMTEEEFLAWIGRIARNRAIT